MIQKVLKVGSSAAVTIPKKSLKELGLKIGDSVALQVNVAAKVVSIRPAHKHSTREIRIAALTLDFVDRYRKDLKALARE